MNRTAAQRAITDHMWDRWSLGQAWSTYGRIFSADVLLLRAPSERAPPAKSPYPDTYALPIFPTNDAGWRALIRGAPRRSNGGQAPAAF